MAEGDENNGGDGRRGTIGDEIFEQVEKLMAEEGLTRTAAFARLSEQTGRRAGTVAANYYRVARRKGATLQPRAPRGSRKRGGGGGTSRAASGSAEAALAKASEALAELSAVVRSQEKELATLRAQSEQMDKLKNMLNRM
ncbi:MAG: hypothetical protein AB7V62_04915 [Thermoleophilia bacterium]